MPIDFAAIFDPVQIIFYAAMALCIFHTMCSFIVGLFGFKEEKKTA